MARAAADVMSDEELSQRVRRLAISVRDLAVGFVIQFREEESPLAPATEALLVRVSIIKHKLKTTYPSRGELYAFASELADFAVVLLEMERTAAEYVQAVNLNRRRRRRELFARLRNLDAEIDRQRDNRPQ